MNDYTISTYDRFTGKGHSKTVTKQEDPTLNHPLFQDLRRGDDPQGSVSQGFQQSVPFPNVVSESVMQEAHRIINGERDGAYGHPTDNFKTIGELWSTLLSFRSGTNVAVSSQDVALMMILLKVARSLNKVTRDNLVDVGGYAGCAAKIAGIDA